MPLEERNHPPLAEDTVVIFTVRVNLDDVDIVEKSLKDWWSSNEIGMVFVKLEALTIPEYKKYMEGRY